MESKEHCMKYSGKEGPESQVEVSEMETGIGVRVQMQLWTVTHLKFNHFPAILFKLVFEVVDLDCLLRK